MANKLRAPILITTLNRSSHFERCIRSLKKCQLSKESDLFIAIDYPSLPVHWAGYNRIVHFAQTITGFKSVNVILREKNFGSFQNSQSAMEYIFESYDKIIVTEDDNVFSEDFLVYMNDGLDFYEGFTEIFSICGYSFPIEIDSTYEFDVYFWIGYSAWGSGHWKAKYLSVQWEWQIIKTKIRELFFGFNLVYKYFNISNSYMLALYTMLTKNVVHGDSYLTLYLFQNKMYSVFPVANRVRNNGHDGTGVNCGLDSSEVYSKQVLSIGLRPIILPDKVFVDEGISKRLYDYGYVKFGDKIKLFVKWLLYYITGRLVFGGKH